MIYEEHPLIAELRTVDPNSMTPLEALTKLAAWKKELDKNSGTN